MWISNVSLQDIKTGYHYDPGPDGVLIQIVDHDMDFPKPAFHFAEVHQFRFLDLEVDSIHSFKEHHAERIVEVLCDALKRRASVVVHCVAGLCRSGAVCEVGVILGFEDTGRARTPNLRVKKMLMECLNNRYAKYD